MYANSAKYISSNHKCISDTHLKFSNGQMASVSQKAMDSHCTFSQKGLSFTHNDTLKRRLGYMHLFR